VTTQQAATTITKKFIKVTTSSFDELGNLCHQRLVGAPQKSKGKQGGSMATL